MIPAGYSIFFDLCSHYCYICTFEVSTSSANLVQEKRTHHLSRSVGSYHAYFCSIVGGQNTFR